MLLFLLPKFRPCDDVIGPCSFPQAHVLLTRKQQLLMVGQPYRIAVNIDMPESEQNLRLGMFMVCAEMRDQRTQLRNHACRSAMLHYRSNLARIISTLAMSPLIVLGLKEETQQIPVEVFSSYEDDQENPVTDVFVEIQSRQIQFYSVTLHITAHFSGLRYIMFHWPILSASIGLSSHITIVFFFIELITKSPSFFAGVGANLFFILTVSLLSWYHWSDSVWMEETRKRLRNRAEESRRKRNEALSTHDMAGLSNDEKSFEDDEDMSIIEDKPHRTPDDDSDEIEELSGFSEGQAIRQRKLAPKSREMTAN